MTSSRNWVQRECRPYSRRQSSEGAAFSVNDFAEYFRDQIGIRHPMRLLKFLLSLKRRRRRFLELPYQKTFSSNSRDKPILSTVCVDNPRKGSRSRRPTFPLQMNR